MAADRPARHRRSSRALRRPRLPLRDVLLRDRVHPALSLTTPTEFDEARARWRQLAGEDAGLGPIAAFHDERLAALAGGPRPDVSVELDAAAAARAVAEGVPLLQAGELSVDPGDVLAELHRASANLAETAEPGTPAQRTAEILASAPIDVAPLLGPTLDGDRASIEREAFRLAIDADALEHQVALALQPFLWEAAAQLAARVDLDTWDRGYCPVCGAWPALAELAGPEKRRVLRCGRCASAWSWFILLCPYCGNDDHRTLRVLQEEGAPERVDVCEACRGYVKAVPSYTPSSAPLLVAQDIATADLDVVATTAGYTRPGDVDVATAGVPRLAREGRTLRPPGPNAGEV